MSKRLCAGCVFTGCLLFGLLVALPLQASQRSSNIEIDGDRFVLKAKGAPQKDGFQVDVEVTGKYPFGCNTEYPWTLRVSSLTGGAASRDVWAAKDALEYRRERVRYRLHLNGTGDIRVELVLRFSLCDGRQCILKTETLSLVLKQKAP